VDFPAVVAQQRKAQQADVNKMGESKYGDKSKRQMYSGFLAKITSAIAVIMTYVWAKTEDTDEKFLGGLNWNEKVFNW
jgi:hypothetical protein